MAHVQTATNASSGASISVTLGSAPTSGNLLVAFVAQQSANTFTPGTGWTSLVEVTSSDEGVFFYKMAGAGESTTQTPCDTSNTARNWAVVVSEYDGMSSTPVLVQDGIADTNATKTSPSVTPTSGLPVLIIGGAFSTSAATTFSGQDVNGSTTGVTERADVGSGSGGNQTHACTWDLEVASTSGSYVTTATASAAENGGIAIAIFEASGGGAPPNAGTASGSYTFAGSAVGEAPPNDGTATGTYDFTGSSAGNRSPGGSGTGGFAFAGSAVGSAPTGINSGTASGTYDLTGSSVGEAPPNAGTASGSYDFTGTSAGGSATGGAATGGYAYAGSSAGNRSPEGSSVGGFAFAGSASGVVSTQGTAAGSYSFAGTAVGIARETSDWSDPASTATTGGQVGTATGGLAFFGSATGSAPVVPDHEGSATGSFVLVGTTAGGTEHGGLVLSWLTFTGTAVGEGIDPTYTFEPPTYQRVLEPPLLTKRPSIALTESQSVVRINGTFAQVKSPAIEQLQAAGVEGEDYFLGGRVYTAIPQAIGLELQAAGYNATEN